MKPNARKKKWFKVDKKINLMKMYIKKNLFFLNWIIVLATHDLHKMYTFNLVKRSFLFFYCKNDIPVQRPPIIHDYKFFVVVVALEKVKIELSIEFELIFLFKILMDVILKEGMAINDFIPKFIHIR